MSYSNPSGDPAVCLTCRSGGRIMSRCGSGHDQKCPIHQAWLARGGFSQLSGTLQTGDVYPSGTQVVGGFQVVGLPSSSAGAAVSQLRSAVASSFPMGFAAPSIAGQRDSVNWGAAYGVPTGRLYALITTNQDGVTGGQINSALQAVARDLKTRLGLVVNLTNAHTLGGAAPLPALTPEVGPDGTTVVPSSVSPLAIGGIAAAGVSVLVGAWMWFGRRRAVARNRRKR